jgi:hypothetical protein
MFVLFIIIILIFLLAFCISKNINIKGGKKLTTTTTGKNLKLTTGKDLKLTTGKNLKLTTGKDLKLTTGKDLATATNGKNLTTATTGKDLTTATNGKNLTTATTGKNLTHNHYYENIGYVEYTKRIYDNISKHNLNLKSLNLALNLKKDSKKNVKANINSNIKKHWTLFETWDKLQKDPIAKKEYLEDKNNVLKNPNLDWSEVTKEICPKLNELREYIGIINLRKGTNILYIKKYEGSPTTAGDENSETTFASIPSNLVNKYSNIVGLFMFHTHPADIRGSPLPSSYDLSAALYFGSISRFAASVIISRYGVLVYGLSQHGYKFLSKIKDYNLGVLNLSFDIIAAHESIRSWANWKLDDYVKFYDRYKMFLYIFPTPEYIADNVKDINEWNIINPISYELIIEHYDDINNYLNK